MGIPVRSLIRTAAAFDYYIIINHSEIIVLLANFAPADKQPTKNDRTEEITVIIVYHYFKRGYFNRLPAVSIDAIQFAVYATVMGRLELFPATIIIVT